MVDQRREVRPDGRKVPAVGQPWKRGGRKEQETPPPNVSSSRLETPVHRHEGRGEDVDAGRFPLDPELHFHGSGIQKEIPVRP